MYKAKRQQKGFTLIELIVVITIIAILAGVAVTNIIDRPGQARTTKAAVDISEISKALHVYKLDNFSYPTTNQGLDALVTKPSQNPVPSNYSAGGYIKKLPKDPWGRDYIYLAPGVHDDSGFDLYSLGADGVEGGEGEDKDITSWDTEE